MLFNSLDFAIFLPIVFLLYWFVFNRNLKAQNIFLVIVSYVFYGWWDWRFLGLILFSTMVDYTLGNAMRKGKTESYRKRLLWISLIVNLGLLGFFKYFNFFVDNFTTAFKFFGYTISESNLNIILPVGISFYTFQTLSYTIDVYRNKLEPYKDFFGFAAFVSFFPQLVAGPIERATNLLPQFSKTRNFNYDSAIKGMQQILWGLFKKVVIADNCALFVNDIFNNYSDYNASTLVLGAVLFAFQIYGDFSGYSDIAIGTAKLFGFNLMQNFSVPYFSRNIAEFWRRWHISLSTWFRDYLYIPLGGSRVGKLVSIRNVFVIFIVSGFWHGANWTFVIWGFLNALYFLPLMLSNNNRKYLDTVAYNSVLPSVGEMVSMLITFGITTFAWIFFRAENLTHALDYIYGIFNSSLVSIPEVRPRSLLLFLIVFIVIEWIGRKKSYAIEFLDGKLPVLIKWSIYYILFYCVLWYAGNEQEFIYFQF